MSAIPQVPFAAQAAYAVAYVVFAVVASTGRPNPITRAMAWMVLILDSGWIVLHVLVTHWLILAIAHMVSLALGAWWLWRNRRRKDRKPSKVAGVVRDLGHRLTVAPVPAGAT